MSEMRGQAPEEEDVLLRLLRRPYLQIIRKRRRVGLLWLLVVELLFLFLERPMDLEKAVRRVIEQEGLIDGGDTVLAGVSGGIDSSTLLFLLNRLAGDMGFSLAVAHVNHQLRGEESAADEAFVKDQAARLGLPCHAARLDVKGYAREKGLSVQHAGRELRYRYFEETARDNGCNKIAVGHNMDDQVETFLLRVAKGTGLSGLVSIPIRRGPIIRPLLRACRSDIAVYCREYSIPYREDSSNRKDAYERNFVRNRIVPLLEKLNPRFREKVLLLLGDIASVNSVFDGEAQSVLAAAVRGEELRIAAADLLGLHEEVRFRVVSGLLSALEPGFTPLREHAALVEKSLLSARPNNTVTLPRGLRVKRVYGDLVFTKKAPAPRVRDVFTIEDGLNEIPELGLTLRVAFSDGRPDAFPQGANRAFFDARGVGRLSLRAFREGDRFTPLGMDRPVKVKDYFISRKMPADARRRVPLLLSDGDIIWVVGERISEAYKVTEGTEKVLEVTAEGLA
jgi:tRNA(Ile)-lysidine synthase